MAIYTNLQEIQKYALRQIVTTYLLAHGLQLLETFPFLDTTNSHILQLLMQIQLNLKDELFLYQVCLETLHIHEAKYLYSAMANVIAVWNKE